MMKFSLFGNLFTDLFVIHRFTRLFDSEDNYNEHFDQEQNELLANLKQHGLKQYINQTIDCIPNDDIESESTTQLQCIQILDKIIHQYGQLFTQITSYNQPPKDSSQTHSNYNYYYSKFFNQSQLVHYTFQFLGSIKLLSICSLVDSIWLINAYHPRNFDGHVVIENEKTWQISNARTWQRMYHASNLTVVGKNRYNDNVTTSTFPTTKWVNGLNSINLSAIKMLLFMSYRNHDAIFGKCINTIFESLPSNRYLNSSRNNEMSEMDVMKNHTKALFWNLSGDNHDVTSTSENEFTQINPSNIECIMLIDTYNCRQFDLIIPNSCNKLCISGGCRIDVSKSCMDGIRSLQLISDCSINNNKQDLEKLAQKCINIQCFQMYVYTKCNNIKQIPQLICWTVLKRYIQHNNAYVVLEIGKAAGALPQQILTYVRTNDLYCNEINFRHLESSVWMSLLNKLDNLSIIQSRLQVLTISFPLNQNIEPQWKVIATALLRLPKLQVVQLKWDTLASDSFNNLLDLLQLIISNREQMVNDPSGLSIVSNQNINLNTGPIMFMLDFGVIRTQLVETKQKNIKEYKYWNIFSKLIYTIFIKLQIPIKIKLRLAPLEPILNTNSTLNLLFNKLRKEYVYECQFDGHDQLYDTLPHVKALFENTQTDCKVVIANVALKKDKLSYYKQSCWDGVW